VQGTNIILASNYNDSHVKKLNSYEIQEDTEIRHSHDGAEEEHKIQATLSAQKSLGGLNE